jgi:aryl-alcohol dehydrogenase-like predicted oxidoreductase
MRDWQKAGRMRYRSLGKSGLMVSVVGLGCNNFGRRLNVEQTRAVVDAAIESGITLLDTAESYGGAGRSEELLGEVLAGRRDQVVLATKFGSSGSDMYGPAAGAKGGRAYIRRAVEHSLRRLRTDYIDLYQIHNADPITPIEETLAALSELVRAGLVRYIGHSNFSPVMMTEAAATARQLNAVPFISAQNHWSLLERHAELEIVPTAVNLGLGVLPYFPLANGLLTGKIRRGTGPAAGTRLAERTGYITAEKLDKVEALADWSQQHGCSVLDVAIGGLAALPGCASVIAGATSADQVRANAAAGEFEPTENDLAEIGKILPVFG